MRPVFYNLELLISKPPENFIYNDATVKIEIDKTETISSSDISNSLDKNKE